MGIAVTNDGRLTADLETIRELRTLCAEDAAELREEQRLKPRVVKVAPAPSDDKIEALIGSLMPVVYVEAMKSFELARQSTAPGELVELRDLYLRQGCRLSVALATLSEALANRRDRGRRFVRVEHVHLHAGGQAIVGAVTSPAAGK
jgi:hypothetical protein